jgi:hypothetical protein
MTTLPFNQSPHFTNKMTIISMALSAPFRHRTINKKSSLYLSAISYIQKKQTISGLLFEFLTLSQFQSYLVSNFIGWYLTFYEVAYII